MTARIFLLLFCLPMVVNGKQNTQDLFAEQTLAARASGMPIQWKSSSPRGANPRIQVVSWWSEQRIAERHAEIIRRTMDPDRRVTGVAQFSPSATHLHFPVFRRALNIVQELGITIRRHPRILLVGPADLTEIHAAVQAFAPSELHLQTAAPQRDAEDKLVRPLQELLAGRADIQTLFKFYGGTILDPDPTLWSAAAQPFDLVLMSMVLDPLNYQDIQVTYFSSRMIRQALENVDDLMTASALFITQGRKQAWPDSPTWWAGTGQTTPFRLIHQAYTPENNFLRVCMKAA